MRARSGWQTARRQAPASRWRRFLLHAEDGTLALEQLLLMAFAVVPCCWAILRLQEVLGELLGFETAVLTSPFF